MFKRIHKIKLKWSLSLVSRSIYDQVYVSYEFVRSLYLEILHSLSNCDKLDTEIGIV